MLRNAMLLIAVSATPALASAVPDGLVDTGCGLGGTESILAFGLVFWTLIRPLYRRS